MLLGRETQPNPYSPVARKVRFSQAVTMLPSCDESANCALGWGNSLIIMSRMALEINSTTWRGVMTLEVSRAQLDTI